MGHTKKNILKYSFNKNIVLILLWIIAQTCIKNIIFKSRDAVLVVISFIICVQKRALVTIFYIKITDFDDKTWREQKHFWQT